MFETAEEACGLILSIGALAEVVDPPELREAVIAQAAAVTARYSAPSRS
jgi:hypothetical protein